MNKKKSKDPFLKLKFIFCILIFNDFFNVILKDLAEHLLVYFFFFSVYPLGSGSRIGSGYASRSGSICTCLGSWIRIRIRIKTFADPKHCIVQCALYNVQPGKINVVISSGNFLKWALQVYILY